jgi:hypothetical protein
MLYPAYDEEVWGGGPADTVRPSTVGWTPKFRLGEAVGGDPPAVRKGVRTGRASWGPSCGGNDG